MRREKQRGEELMKKENDEGLLTYFTLHELKELIPETVTQTLRNNLSINAI